VSGPFSFFFSNFSIFKKKKRKTFVSHPLPPIPPISLSRYHTSGDGEYVNGEVTTATFKHRPFGDESAELLECSRPVHDDILLAKMRPGQRISAELHAEKGIGRVHAKWSPVATASYRLLPEITVFDDVTGTAADELVATCPMKVFDIEDAGSPQRRAVAARPRDCTMCRECIRPAGWDKRVRLTRVRDHFLFTIESTGALSAEDLFREAIKVFRAKLANVVSMLDAKEAPEDNE
jgi:DNA-directed RNA polymerase alpha subunit